MEVMKMMTQEEIGKTPTRKIRIILTSKDNFLDKFQMMEMMVTMETMEMTMTRIMILSPQA